MSDIYRCDCCKFEINVGENSQNEILLLPTEKLNFLKSVIESNKKLDKFSKEHFPFWEGCSFVIDDATNTFIRCPKCKILILVRRKYADFISILMPETKIIIPQLVPIDGYGYPENISTAVFVSESYFSNTLLEKENKISCLCGNNNIRENSYFDYDYLAFPWLLMISLGELSEQEKYKNIPIEDRMRYVYLTTYQVHECPTCQRFIIIGKNEQNQQFKAIYKRK